MPMSNCYNATAPNWHPKIIRMASSYTCQKAKIIVVLVVCIEQGPELRWLHHMDIGNPPFRTPYKAPLVHTEEYIYAFCDNNEFAWCHQVMYR
jgi:hypothetical protein